MKKTLLLLVAVLTLVVLAACGTPQDQGGNQTNALAGTYDITLWVSETAGVKELTASQIDAFEAANPGITINATVEGVGEGDAATQVLTDVATAPDIYCFAQDQLTRLVQANALAKLGNATTETVKQINDAGSVKAASVAGTLYAFPLTSDNGYFMYYDKSVISEDIVDDLDAIVAACEAAGKNISFNVEGDGWYTASFYFATGCTSTWTTDDAGEFTAVQDDFNSEKGLIALKGMQKLLTSPAYNNSSSAKDFGASIPSAVVVSGTWDSTVAKEILGDNYGATDLPSFTVDGQSYHLSSFSGNKLMGVKPQDDAKKAAVCQQLALYLTGEACQVARFEEFGWGPSNLNAQKLDAVVNDLALSALAAQSQYATPQGNIHGSWWSAVTNPSVVAKTGASEAELQAALNDYKAVLDALVALTPAQRRAFTIIGSVNGASWDTDFLMTETETDVWVSNDVFTLAEGQEFKIRQGFDWKVAFGAQPFDAEVGLSNQANFVVSADQVGSYKIKLTITRNADGNIASGVVELIAQ